MRIAIAQMKSVLGDLSHNVETIKSFVKKGRDDDLIIFPESTLIGYPPQDLLQRFSLLKAQRKALKVLSQELSENQALLLGLFTQSSTSSDRKTLNSATFLQKNKPPQFFYKTLIPHYGLFDELRNVEPCLEPKNNFFCLKGFRFQVLICEDLWGFSESEKHFSYKKNPLYKFKNEKKDAILSLNASPFCHNKPEKRKKMAQSIVSELKAPLIYVNSVGAQDEIIFDGRSFVMDKEQNMALKLKSFKEDLKSFTFPLEKTKKSLSYKSKKEDSKDALLLGLKEFLQKTDQKNVCLGLSGGIDSALVASLASEALGSDKVHCIAMPSSFNLKESLTLAKQLAQNLNAHFYEFPITKLYEVMKEDFEKYLGNLKESITLENLQARIRGMILMAFSNDKKALLLCTANKSELATGYMTMYGDAIGAIAPIGDLLKTEVYDFSKTHYSHMIPKEIILRAPSAELKKNQRDQDTLPPYETLDGFIESMIHKGESYNNKEEKKWLKIILKNEFKRRQAPPSLRVHEVSFNLSLKLPLQPKFWF